MSIRKKIKSRNIGFFSDIHMGLGRDSVIWQENILKFAEWAKNIYEKRDITEIIIPGDIFHNRSEISVNTLATAAAFFQIFKNFNLYISTGNHDCHFKNSSDINSISILKGWTNITLVDEEPVVFDTPVNKTLSLIPWGIKVEDVPKTDICVGHFEINSFKMNVQKICDHGVNSSDLLDRSPYIISGHFHHKDHRKYERGDVLYLGSPYQQNFADSGSERGIYIFDLKTNEFEFIVNNISPQHWKVSLQKILDKTLTSQHLKNIIPNNMISFVIDTKHASEKISLLASKLQSLKPKFFRIDYQTVDNNLSSTEGELNYNSIDIPKSLQDFVNTLETSNKEDTISYLSDLYTKLTA
jgi:DNA repair exonuclease SbcCD nuclease subunit